MIKTIGAMAGIFTLGAGTLSSVGDQLGGSAEAVSLALMGLGFIAASHGLSSRWFAHCEESVSNAIGAQRAATRN